MNSSPYRILLVDDELFILEFWKIVLEKRGFCITLATSGKSALDVARKLKPNAIMSDYNMPNGNGAFLYDALREEGILPEHFVLCSGNVGAFFENTPFATPDAVFSKPISVPVVIETFEKCRLLDAQLSENIALNSIEQNQPKCSDEDAIDLDLEIELQYKAWKILPFE